MLSGLLRRWWLTPSVVVPPLVAAVWVLTGGSWMSSDLDVYRSGADHVLHGLSLYAAWPGLPFTYPPFAALVLAPLAVVPAALATVLWLLLSWLAYLGFAGVLLARLGLRGRRLVLALAAGLAFEPVWHTVALGQINLVLGLLIVLDTLVLPARWRGLGVGIAAGIKLTPAIFLLYFALRREWWAMARAAAGLAITMAISAVVVPSDAWDYWTRLFYAADRIPGVEYVNNQSLHAVLIRAAHDLHPSLVLGAVADVLALALTALAAHRQLRRGHDVAALVAVAVGGLLVSPVSWTHHWIWLVPAAGVLLTQRRYVGAALITATAVAAPMRFLPKTLGRELHYVWWQELICAAYVVVGIVYLLLMLLPESAQARRSEAPSRRNLGLQPGGCADSRSCEAEVAPTRLRRRRPPASAPRWPSGRRSGRT